MSILLVSLAGFSGFLTDLGARQTHYAGVNDLSDVGTYMWLISQQTPFQVSEDYCSVVAGGRSCDDFVLAGRIFNTICSIFKVCIHEQTGHWAGSYTGNAVAETLGKFALLVQKYFLLY